MDPTLLAGIIGAVSAITGSILSHVLIFYFNQRMIRAERSRLSLEYAMVFLERCKLGHASRFTDEEYLELIQRLSVLDKKTREEIVDLYELSNDPSKREQIFVGAGSLQDKISNRLS